MAKYLKPGLSIVKILVTIDRSNRKQESIQGWKIKKKQSIQIRKEDIKLDRKIKNIIFTSSPYFSWIHLSMFLWFHKIQINVLVNINHKAFTVATSSQKLPKLHLKLRSKIEQPINSTTFSFWLKNTLMALNPT